MEQIMQRSRVVLTKKRKGWTPLCLAIAVAIWIPAIASADIVSGRIFGLDEKPIANGTFTAKDAKGGATAIKTNAMGNFSVYLDPGKFTISYSADPTLTGVIESFPQPRQQDVHLKKSDGK
jgi:hypothetical protein